MTMRLTGRGVAVLVAAVPLLVFGHWGGYPLLRALGAVALVAVLAAVVITARGLKVEVRRDVYPDRVERGSAALARLRVKNPGEGRQPAALATDGLGGRTQTVRIRPLAPGAEAAYHYELPTGARGRHPVGPLTLHRTDPFGLSANRLPTGETSTLWVHPRQLPARVLVSGHPRHHHEGARTDDSLRGSVDLQDVREYQPGDEVRHVHWKATARSGRLMVRDLIDPEQPRFTLLLDTRADALPPEGFEEAVDVAASLLVAAARAGSPARLVTSSGIDLPTPGGLPATRQLLDELCQVRQTGPDDSLVPAALAARSGSGGCLVMVTSAGVGLPALSWLNDRFASIFLIALGAGRRAGAVAGARVLGAPDAAAAVRQWNEVAG
ncbi:hypothetical protein GCM10027445_64520 [Amycolatopsis endophytica]|uniref:Uncharacterized protein (DUF58 family) n=1 Tax=Amycolatopsis endophytica TaxID=860233 RepID=A0A853B4C1_9PSEU|nr:DUF58 domain-containing protein [Amycolatopsis endophytica]NYI89840.1 uncharacterized protein (DUF58 family) [Amycolatopsis endophytica]